ncbi:glycoside hydrolase superfamily [Hyaloraphidium curvatum]|nr:glycoside hydrolase superfamily [Hyaloraphidium curvatum]
MPTAPVTLEESLPPDALRTRGRFFRDNLGRAVHLRGVNVAPNAKTPANQPSQVGGEEFFDAEWQRKSASFVGQPFPLEQADEHFARLRRWGFNFVRFNITWEAIEHGGPGVYDTAYIEYVVAVLRKARDHGVRCFIDPHQDVWSRWSGGDGAPLWTLDLVGFKPSNFNATGAAIVHNTYEGDKHHFPMMIWPTNYRKLAAFTMFTLFWAGRTFAPKFLVDPPPWAGTSEKINVQDYLQMSFLRSMLLMARAIVEAGLQDSCVIGYDTFNEPNEGLLGTKDLSQQMSGSARNGTSPTPFEAMCLGEGLACEVDVWGMGGFGPYRSARKVVDPRGLRAWKDGHQCVWKQHGVWTFREPKDVVGPQGVRGAELLVPDYFTKDPSTGKAIDLDADFLQPFFYRYAATVRSAQADAIILIEPRVMNPPADGWDERTVAEYGAQDGVTRAAIGAGLSKEVTLEVHFGDRRIAYTPHWYDGLTLVNKQFRSWFNVDALSFLRAEEHGLSLPFYQIIRLGEYYVRHVFADNVRRLAEYGWNALKGEVPVVFGEYGLPYDMMQKLAYRTGDYALHETALDAYFNAMEHTLLDTALWCYCASNCNEWGDNWNGEDLSIFSLDVHPSMEPTAETVPHGFSPLDRGGRALNAVCRPFASAVAGTPTRSNFDMADKRFEFEFEHRTGGGDDVEEEGVAPLKSRTTEIFLPRWHYPTKADVLVKVSHGKWKIVEEQVASQGPSASETVLKLVWDCGCPLDGERADGDRHTPDRRMGRLAELRDV